jgi:hypothetical protein
MITLRTRTPVNVSSVGHSVLLHGLGHVVLTQAIDASHHPPLLSSTHKIRGDHSYPGMLVTPTSTAFPVSNRWHSFVPATLTARVSEPRLALLRGHPSTDEGVGRARRASVFPVPEWREGW